MDWIEEDVTMHILICSFLFDKDAEGLCTGRLVRALLDRGMTITVVTSDVSDTTLVHPNLNFIKVPAPPRPGRRALNVVVRLLGQIPTDNYLWSRRVAALSLREPPLLIYGRSQPFSSIVSALALSLRTHIPLVTHLSDPIPSPWLDEKSRGFNRGVKYIRRIVEASRAVTFTTPQALEYQQKITASPLSDKAFVLNHIAPEPALLPDKADTSSRNFLYLGSFYGNRTATHLLDGFGRHLRLSPASRMLFVGTDPDMVLPEANRLGLADFVKVLPRVSDTRPLMEQADALVAVDSPIGPPVFLTTKLVEYLVVNRPILLLSPENSPGWQLVAGFSKSVARVHCSKPEEIGHGMDQCCAMLAGKEHYLERFQGMEAFRSDRVAANFITELSSRGLL